MRANKHGARCRFLVPSPVNNLRENKKVASVKKLSEFCIMNLEARRNEAKLRRQASAEEQRKKEVRKRQDTLHRQPVGEVRIEH